MAKVKSNSKATDQKITRQQVEEILTNALSGITNGNEISKQLHKKIKKAGKIITVGLHESKKRAVKKSDSAKKAAKKPVTKKVAKKATPK